MGLSARPALAAPASIFADEFNAATLDTNAWIPLNRPDGEGAAQYYSPANVSLGGGFLKILTKVDSTFSCCGYTSEMVQWRSLSFTYGSVEARIQFPGGSGPWPALWLLGKNCQATNPTTQANVGTCNWPATGSDEIDIAEILFSNTRVVNQQIHSNDHNDGCMAPAPDVSAGFHTYRLDWQPGSLVWSIDGATTCTVSGSFVPRTPMFLIMDTAVGLVGGTIVDSTLPQTFSVDYVRVTAPAAPVVATAPAIPGAWTALLGGLLALAGLIGPIGRLRRSRKDLRAEPLAGSPAAW